MLLSLSILSYTLSLLYTLMATKRISAELKYGLFNLNLSFNLLKPSEEARRAIILLYLA